MSGSRLVRDSPDLARLVQEGYAVRIVNAYLVVDDIPFVGAGLTVERGSLICPLDLSGDRTVRPANHVMCFAGGEPRDKNGQPIDGLVNPGVDRWAPSEDLVPACGFSQKPGPDGYADFYEKVTYYAAMVIGPAQARDPSVTPLTFKPFVTDEDDGVFCYLDTFSSRAGITARNQRIAVPKVVIVGLGGAGGYLLDFLAKTPVEQVHLYDDDIFGTHNAFRAPGAASLDTLRAAIRKVDYYADIYRCMRRGIVTHHERVTAKNVTDILDADFVFLTMDPSADKRAIVKALIAADVPFVDSGIGVSDDPNGIAGQIRVTSSTPGRSEHIERDGLISYFLGEGDDDDYNTNVQIAELNSLAATLAVVRFKKYFGFYADVEGERHSVYDTDATVIHNRYGESDRQKSEDLDRRSISPAKDVA